MNDRKLKAKYIVFAAVPILILAILIAFLQMAVLKPKKEIPEKQSSEIVTAGENRVENETTTVRDFKLDEYRKTNAEYNIMPYMEEVLPENQRIVNVAAADDRILFITVTEAEPDAENGKIIEYGIYEMPLEGGRCEKKCQLVKAYEDNRKISTSTLKINNASPLIFYDYYDKAITVFSDDYKKTVEVGNAPLDFSNNYYEEAFPDSCCYSNKYNAVFYVSQNTSKLMRMNFDVLMQNAVATEMPILKNEIMQASVCSEEIMECEYGLGYKYLAGIEKDLMYFDSYDMYSNAFMKMVYNFESKEYEHIYSKDYKSPVCSRADDTVRLNYTSISTEPAEPISQGDYTLYDSENKKSYRYLKKNSSADNMSMGKDFIIFTQWDEAAEKITEITIWKYGKSAGETFEEGEHKAVQLPKENESILTDAVDELEKKYDINIVLGDDVVNQIPNYSVAVEKNTGKVKGALAELDKALAIYPDTFFSEIKSKGFINLNIYLTGAIVPTDSKGLKADGVTCSNWGYECIALDINSPDIATTLIHEISHVTDDKLQRLGKLEDLNDKWMECNPEGFEYYDSYSEYVGDEKNTSYDENYWWNDDPEIVYFFDDYSKTYVKEDRARLLEHFNDFKSMDDCYNSSHIRKKLEVYFEYLKDNFESFGDFENTYWGRLITELSQ